MTTRANKTTKTTRRGFGRDSIMKPTTILANQLAKTQDNSIESNSITLSTASLISTPPIYTSETSANFTHVTQIRIDAHLFASIHNAVESAIFGGDYSIESASHFIREALKDHAAGAPLKVAHENGVKKSLSIRIDEKLKCFWNTLPKRHRNNILERAIRTKLLSYQH
jgi:hypothetical protein